MLAYTLPIADTPWGMVVKIDKAEALAPIRRLETIAWGVASVFVALFVWLAGLWWQRLEHARRVQGELESQVAQRTVELNRSNEQLRDSTARITTMFDTVADGIITIDERGTVETFNPAAERLFGYAAAEVIGQNINLLMPEPYRSEHDGYLARYRAGGAARIIGKSVEVTGQHKAGSTFPLELVVSEMRLGEARHFTGVIRDITERRAGERAARYLNDAVQAIPDGFTIYGPDDRLVLCNSKYREIYGLASIDRLEGRSFEEILRIGLANGDYPAALGREDAWLAERIFAHHNPGAPFDQLLHDGRWVRITEVRLSDGSIAGMRADITELKHAEAASQAARATAETARTVAEAANRAKSDFLAAMSHEIRTPMNGVIGMIDVLQQSSLKGHQIEMVDTIRDSAFSLLAIIEDILDFSKIEAGKLEVEQVPTEVAEVVEKACGMLDHLALKKDVDLTLFTDPAIPALVIGDPQRLRQIIINLANNAIKFSSGQGRPGRVAVRAVLAARTTERVVIEICVTDNGIGMDAAAQARLFTAFTQADASTTRRFGGSGLGLTIARNLAELMGGDISVQSTPGQGSAFTLRLPCVAVAEAAGVATGAAPLLAGLSCLAVGVTDSLSDDLAAYLSAAGALVERVADLAAAGRRDGPAAPGPWIWLIDAGSTPPTPDTLRALLDAHTAQHLRCVIVVGRGKRRLPRQQAGNQQVFEIDANALTRQSVLNAVAIAAGRLPVMRDVAPTGKGHASLAPPARADALRQGRLILVAEDNETNQKVILQQLALLGYAADVAADGQAALERWQSGDYDLLLTDLHMPAMDGYELAMAIREHEAGQRHTPVIALTANALKGEAERCRAAGMDDYLSKPTPLTELRAMLEKWLPATAAAVPDLPDEPAGAVPSAPTFGAGGTPNNSSAPTLALLDANVLDALAASNERIRAILDSIGEGVHGIDLNSNIVFANPVAVAMLGWDLPELIGRSAHTLTHHTRADGSPYPVSECNILATRQDGLTRHIEDEVFWRKDGSSFPVAYTCSATRNSAGELTGVVVSFSDITERKQNETVLIAAKDAAELANRGKDSFLATMSHEIRTPLGGLLGMLELLSLSPLSPAQDETLQKAWDSGRSLLRILNDILDWSKIENGKLELAPRATSIGRARGRGGQHLCACGQRQQRDAGAAGRCTPEPGAPGRCVAAVAGAQQFRQQRHQVQPRRTRRAAGRIDRAA